MSTNADVLNAVVARLVALEPALFTEANAYIVDKPEFRESEHEIFAQVSVGDGSFPHAASGVGLMQNTVRVTVYRRLARDVSERDDQRIASAAGVVALLDTIEQRMTHSYLGGVLVSCLTPTAPTAPATSGTDEAPDWVSASIGFDFTMDAGFPNPQVKNDGTTPDNGTA